jgi:hypothetical protein
MGRTYSEITPELRGFIERQKLFFVATAPSDSAGHVNVSPKGLDAFRIFSPSRVGYVDLTGSGNETSAHIEQNRRITFMFCALDGDPLVVRVYGTGKTILPGEARWGELAREFDVANRIGVRQIILAEVQRVGTSCGFGVPLYDYRRERDELTRYAQKKGPQGLQRYQQDKNARSIDGIITPIGLNQ